MPKEFLEEDLYLHFEDSSNGLPRRTEQLIEHQLNNWKLASDGYKSLSAIQKKQFEFDGFTIEAHYNPGRIISSSAKVDAQSIKERPCFLCTKNLPKEQKAVCLPNNYMLLLNPFPIFDRHFTIPTTDHIPQAIKSEVGNLLSFSSLLGKDYSMFYNGPRCGASAPDHLHFQAGNFGFMKIDNEYSEIIKRYGKIIYEDNALVTRLVTGCLRNFIALESISILKLEKEFKRIYDLLNKEKSYDEPMMNVISNYNDEWRLLIFPRSKHRPSYFFEEGAKKILISPAAVDLGGILIFPREEDFNKVTKDLIVDIFQQVTIDDNEFSCLNEKLVKSKDQESML